MLSVDNFLQENPWHLSFLGGEVGKQDASFLIVSKGHNRYIIYSLELGPVPKVIGQHYTANHIRLWLEEKRLAKLEQVLANPLLQERAASAINWWTQHGE